jgi:TonB family protein
VGLLLPGDGDPPPRATAAGRTRGDGPTRRPELRNAHIVQQELEKRTRQLQRVGLSGTVRVWVYVDDSGRVAHRRLADTTGHCELDTAALDVSRTMRFTPALSGGERVSVWVEIPIIFAGR